MRLITGDECGLIKECIPELSVGKGMTNEAQSSWNGPMKIPISKDKGFLKVNGASSAMARRNGVAGLTWVQEKDDASFASLRLDGVVQVWERSSMDQGDFGKYRPLHEESSSSCFSETGEIEAIRPATKPLGLYSFQNDTSDIRLCACNAFGQVAVLNPLDEDAPLVLKRFSTVKSNDEHNKFGLPFITATAVDKRNQRVAVGGQERETTLWDLETSKQVWKAKNLGADPQTLLPPQVWPSAISFLHEADTSIGSNLMAIGSAHCEVRLYDIRDDSIQRRPISYTPNGLIEYRVTSLCQIDPFNIVVGDSSGDIHTLDLRTLGKKKKDKTVSTMGRFVGPGGSIRMMAKHKEHSTLAAVGLDRMLRLYDSKTRKHLYCMYMKQRLNCVLFGEEPSLFDGGEDIDQEDEVIDYQDSDNEYSVNEESEGSGGQLDDDQDASHDEGLSEEDGSDSNSSGLEEEEEESDDESEPRKKAKHQ